MTADLSAFTSFPTSKLPVPNAVCAPWKAMLIRSDAGSYDAIFRSGHDAGGCRGEMSLLGAEDGFIGYADWSLYLVWCFEMNVMLTALFYREFRER